ncbi:MAG TPA: Hpt domain-containing protein, partial [Paraburkholderia sp.]
RVEALACGDEAIAAEFMRILIDTNRATLAAMDGSARRAAWGEFGNVAHRLSGSLRLFNCDDVIALTSRMEQAARKRDSAKVHAILPVFTAVVESLNAVLMDALDPAGTGYTGK